MVVIINTFFYNVKNILIGQLLISNSYSLALRGHRLGYMLG